METQSLRFSESTVEEAALSWLGGLGYSVLAGPEIGPGELLAEASAVIQELIELAREMREAQERGEKLGLTPDEEAFYDALGVNDSAVQVLGDDTLKTIARELVEMVRKNVTIDWTAKESVRAKLRVMVKRILRKYGYPPDKQENATLTVLQQAELICAEWAA